MGQRTLDGTDITKLRERYTTLVHERLPEAAQEEGWPIDRDHCFARVILDTLFEDEWYDHVDGRPAYEHLSQSELEVAVAIAEQMIDGGRSVVTELNTESLRYRGEL